MKRIDFRKNNEVITSVDISLNQLMKLSENLQTLFFNSNELVIQNNVDEDIICQTANYISDFKNVPNITPQNAYQFRQLSDEFDLPMHFLDTVEMQEAINLSILLNATHNSSNDLSSHEKYISQRLDLYLRKYSKTMYHLSIQSLYNIFYHVDRILNDHEFAYKFITCQIDPNLGVNNPMRRLNADELFILLGSLDAAKISQGSLKESITNRNSHFGFIPQLDFDHLSNIITQNDNLLKEKNDMEARLEDQSQFIADLQYKLVKCQDQNQDLQLQNGQQANCLLDLHNTIQKLTDSQSLLQQTITQQKIASQKLEEEIQMLKRKLGGENVHLSILNQWKKRTIQRIADEKKLRDSLARIHYSPVAEVYKSALLAGENINSHTQSIIQIPDTFSRIPDYCFPNDRITSITLPSTVKTIGQFAFSKCNCLSSVAIPDSVTFIGAHAFSYCPLKAVEIPRSVAYLGSYAFSFCNALETFNLPSSVTFVGDGILFGCSKLTSLALPNSLTDIPASFASRCTSLSVIDIPSSVRTIHEYAFAKCSSLTKVTMVSVVTIEKYAFSKCSSLPNIDLPSTLIDIEQEAFRVCTSLTSVTIPSSVLYIGDYVFRGCSNLLPFRLPTSVKYVGSDIFLKCKSPPESNE